MRLCPLARRIALAEASTMYRSAAAAASTHLTREAEDVMGSG
ncbi:hypothetical protein AB0K16_45515 [Nonomuraea jabiensis]